MRTKLKHRWSVGHNYLTGITFGAWMRLLAQNGFRVSPAYLHRAAFITAASLPNSAFAAIEKRRFGRAIEAVQITRPPLFILGHWRSGTTHLHDLLACDRAQFQFANTYRVVNPLTFLTTENLATRMFSWLVPPKRPMDNMALSFASPQEDEFAPLLMSLCSLYLGISFPARQNHYERQLSFRGADPAEVAAWKDAFLTFCKKLSLNDSRTLLLKSPPIPPASAPFWKSSPMRALSISTATPTACSSRSGISSTRRAGTPICNAPIWTPSTRAS